DKIKSTVGNDYVIVSKNHVFLNNKNKDSITNVTTETQELLLIGDYLISDYSSVIFDAFAIDLPVVLLANDFEKYQKSRGVYESIWKDLLPFVSYTEEELGKAILNYNINTQEYKNVKEKFSYLNNGEDLVNFILNI
ncbi:MAG: CDP-glycerol glycerophosphotransferase family protein, partial [Clostridiales bacterium]